MAKWLLLGIISLGFFLRVINLSDAPAGFTPDEASFGYDAYSLLETGKDQWGSSWPLTFKSFGDYKLPLYTYLAMPSIAVFGLNEFATRLPNALIGTLAIIATYFLAKQTTKDTRVALFASLLLAISPWHIPLSRGAFEANLTTFFLPAGLVFLFKGLKSPHWLPLAALFLGLNLFTYHSARLLTIPLALFILFEHRQQIKISVASIVGGLIIGVFALVAFYSMLIGGAGRVASSGIFNPTGGWSVVADGQFAAINSGQSEFAARLFNNKILHFASVFFDNYLSYFSPQFLFTDGPAEATYGMVPGMGVLFLFEIIFLLFAFKKKLPWWLLAWIFIAPVAASLAKGPGYAANRAAFMMPGIQILSSIGGIYLFDYLRKRISVNKTTVIFASVFGVSFLLFMNNYFVNQKALFAKDMIYGAKEVFASIGTQSATITKKISEGHIYAAFYQKIDPEVFQVQSGSWDFEFRGFVWVDQLQEYRLDTLTFSDNVNAIDKIVVSDSVNIPSIESRILKIIYYPNGKPAYVIRINKK